MRSPFFHLRKAIKLAMPNEVGAGKSLQMSDNFNDSGKMTYAHGDFDQLIGKLQAAIGQSYVVQHNKQTRSITIRKITDV